MDEPLHVVPLNDARPHLLSSRCWCKPRLDPMCDAPLYIHNAADGRELFEPHGLDRAGATVH